MAQQSSDHEGLALAYRIRANALEDSNRRPEAIEVWLLAADEFVKAKDIGGQIESLASAGALLLKSDLPKAEHLFETALAAGKSEKSPSLDIARGYYAAGNACMRLKQIGPAKKFYTVALEIIERSAPDSLDEAQVYEGLGRVSLEARDDPNTALKYFREEPAHRRKAFAWFRLGRTQLLQNRQRVCDEI